MIAKIDAVWGWLMSLDAPTRAAIIGGFATLLSVLGALLGVYANLAWNRKKHRNEMSYNLRRDVYLEAIDVMNGAGQFLAAEGVPSGKEDTDKNKKEDVARKLFGVCAKVHLLAGKRLIAAVIAFQSVFEEWSNKLLTHERVYEALGKRHDDVMKRLEASKELVTTFTAQRDEAVQVIDKFDLASTDPEARKKAMEAATFLKEKRPVRGAELTGELDLIGKDLSRISDERFRMIGASLNYILEIPKSLAPFLHEITVAMKDELGLRSDERWYKNEMKKASEESFHKTRELFEREPVIKELKSRVEASSGSNAEA